MTCADMIKTATEAQFRRAAIDTVAGRLLAKIVRRQGRAIQGRSLRPLPVWTLDGERIKAEQAAELLGQAWGG